MNYLISAITFNKTNQTQAQEYMKLDLKNAEDPFDEPASTIIFNERIISLYKTEMRKAQNNVNNLPENLRHFMHAFNVTIDLPQPMFRRWGRKFIDSAGRSHEPNDLVCDKNNTPKLYKNFRVLCKKTLDNETGELDWAAGWDPISRGNTYISSFFVAPTQAPTQNNEAPIQPPVDVAQPVVQPISQVVQQPIQQQQVVQQSGDIQPPF